MSEAARSLNYQGVVVYRDAQMFETLHLLHRNRDGQERERLGVPDRRAARNPA